jgi:hypothetical protein
MILPCRLLAGALACALGLAAPAQATAAADRPLTIDVNFPGGNIIVDRIEADDVRLRQDLRDTAGPWFYWQFRARQAAGRTVRFHFTGGRVLGPLGPAYSLDGGSTWRWLGSRRTNTDEPPPKDGFLFRFPTAVVEVRFCFAIPYVESDLRRFLCRYERSSALKEGVLCKTAGGRSVEVLYLGRLDGQADYRLAFTCRHHACESVASFALEGLMESVLAADETGRWFRKHVAVLVVPFVDKDGVEAGDQGKNRKPHDHNRDYRGAGIYPAVRAIKKLLPAWSGGRLDMTIDLHCPSINDNALQFIGNANQAVWQRTVALSQYLGASQAGPLRYHADGSGRVPFGRSWNQGDGLALASFAGWASGLPNIQVATSIEIPYSLIGREPVSAPAVRAFGHDLARAIRMYLERKPGETTP